MTKRGAKQRPTARIPIAAGWLAAFFVATVIAFSSAIKAPFEYDDIPAIEQNASIRQLGTIFSAPPQLPVSGRPVVNATLALNYAINDALGIDQRADPQGPTKTISYHVLNILLHNSCGLLLFRIARRTLRRFRDFDAGAADRIAGVATLLWLLHPIQTEAVHYLNQRTELIVSVWYAATLYASIRAWDSVDDRSRRRWYTTGIISCCLGMLSKEVMATAPFMVVLYDRAFRAGSWSALRANASRMRFYVALFASLVLVLWSVLMGARSLSVGFGLGVTWYEYFYMQAWAVARYVRLIFFPAGLTFDYGDVLVTGMRPIPGLIVLGACFIGMTWAWTKQRWLWLAFIGAWFFLILAPSSSVVPIKTELAAERRIYLAGLSIFVLVAIGIHRLAAKMHRGPRVEIGIAAALAAVLGVVTFVRGQTYASSEKLYRDTIAKAPENPRASVSLGLALARLGPARFDDAMKAIRDAIAKDSNYFVAWRSLAFLEATRGNWREAAPAYARAVHIQPDNIDVNLGLARSLVALGRIDDALPYIDRVGPIDPPLLWSVGNALTQSGRGVQAIKYLEAAANSSSEPPPSVGVALISLAYAQAARTDDAVMAARAATSTAADTIDVYILAGRAMTIAKHPDEARGYLERALAIDPRSEAARKAVAELPAKR
jgi:tetratricopeptide (TPR) repeat protein